MPYQATKEKLTHLHSKYEKYYAAAFFILGFVFDIFTLDRIDNIYLILQQTIYLLIIAFILYRQTQIQFGLRTPPQANTLMGRFWHYSNELLHFLLGSLLSVYFLFYFVSSSLATSSFFLILMFALLVANETPRLQSQAGWIKFILFWICVFSFFSVLVPVLLGFTNFFTLLLSLILGASLSLLFWRKLHKKTAALTDPSALPLLNRNLKKSILFTNNSVALALLILYFLKLLPPIPLSIQYIGVYHNIVKQGDTYSLSYSRPWYKFWQNGAQTFYAEPNDKIFIFARIFSPSSFNDDVVFHWQKQWADGWVTSDQIRTRITGGRDQGFRGYSTKSKFDAGEWRVKIETTDGREIGRINFDVYLNSTVSEREFKVDQY